MATAITSATVSEEWTKFDTDWIFDGTALANADAITSAEFDAGMAQGGVAVRVLADTTVAIATDATATIELLYDATSGGSFSDSVTLYEKAVEDDAVVFEIGDEIVEYLVGDIGPYCKLKISTSADESGDKVDAYLRFVSR